MGTKWPSALDPARTRRTWGKGTPSQGQAPRGSFPQGRRQGISIFQEKPDIVSVSLLRPPEQGGESGCGWAARTAPAGLGAGRHPRRGRQSPVASSCFHCIYLYDDTVGDPFTFIRAAFKMFHLPI